MAPGPSRGFRETFTGNSNHFWPTSYKSMMNFCYDEIKMKSNANFMGDGGRRRRSEFILMQSNNLFFMLFHSIMFEIVVGSNNLNVTRNITSYI